MQVVNNSSHPIKGGSSLHFTKLRRFSRLCSGIVISIALLAVTGWILDLAWLKSALPGLPTMKINTALSLFLAGLGLALLNDLGDRYKKVSLLLFILVILDGGVNLSQYLFEVDLGIDQFLLKDYTNDTTFPGRMAIITAINFVMVGGSGVLLTRAKSSFYFAHVLLVIAFSIAFTALLGYCYGIRSFYFGIGEYAAMALHTAIAFIFLTVGLLIKYPDEGITGLLFSPHLRKYLIHEYLFFILGLPALFLGLLLLLYRKEQLAPESVFLIFTVSFTVFTGTVYWLKLLSISEQEAHNAALRTSKNELLVSNQKLSVTNEELAVMNEELQTANEQLFLTVAKLNEANDTIQRLSQEALQKSELKYRDLAESVTDMFLALNEDLQCTYWNQACEAFSGMKAEEVLGKSIFEVIPQLRNGEVKAIAGKVLQTHKTISFTVNTQAYLSSTNAFLEVSVYPSQKGLSVFVKDITERKKKELQLTQIINELQNYKNALDKSILVSITNREGIIQQANEMFCYLTKYTLEELLGQDHRIINSYYHPKSFFTKMWQTISSGKYWRDEIKNKAKDGTYFWVDMVITPVLNDKGEIIQYLAICYDITDRKETEEKIAESERLYRLTAGNFPGYILIINQNRTLSFLEGKSLLTNGWLKPDLIGKSIFSLLEPEVEKQLDNYITLAFKGEEASFEFLVKERVRF